MYEYFACIYVSVPCVPGTHGVQKRVRDQLQLDTDSCEPPHGCWKPIPCLLQQQQVLVTVEPFPVLHLQFLKLFFDVFMCIYICSFLPSLSSDSPLLLNLLSFQQVPYLLSFYILWTSEYRVTCRSMDGGYLLEHGQQWLYTTEEITPIPPATSSCQ